jgi:polyphosphate kinase
LRRLKTHAKVALVVRREEQGLRRYIHLGTGNYNATTAKIYEDLCLFTCRPDIGADATELFNALTGYWSPRTYRSLLVAPTKLRTAIVERIEREIRIQEEHGNGRLIFKTNALTDPDMVRLLYRASQAGVQIDLIIRGMCCLRPGMPGISETVRVRSIVGRFLEHSRIYYFGNNGHEEIYLGSADLMPRNLNDRVETLFPIDSRVLRKTIRDKVLQPALDDTVNAYELHADGCYTRVRPQPDAAPFDCQVWFISHPLFESEKDAPEAPIGAQPSSA